MCTVNINSLPQHYLLTSISLDTNSSGPVAATPSFSPPLVQASSATGHQCSRLRGPAWRQLPGGYGSGNRRLIFLMDCEGSTLGSVALLRIRMGSSTVNQRNRHKLRFPQKTFALTQAHGFQASWVPYSLSTFSTPTLPCSESCWVVDLSICTGRPVSWGKQPSHRTVVAQDGDRMRNFSTCL